MRVLVEPCDVGPTCIEPVAFDQIRHRHVEIVQRMNLDGKDSHALFIKRSDG